VALRSGRIALAQFLAVGCVIMFTCEHAQAQPGYVPPPTPLPKPVFNPPSRIPWPNRSTSRSRTLTHTKRTRFITPVAVENSICPKRARCDRPD
jgi:hypothetical protein